MKKKLDDSNLLPPFKKHSQFIEFETFGNSKYLSKFQESFITCQWGVMYMTYKTKL
jgi:hypothetical protein